jgi:serine/threonine-protein kinase
VAYFLWRYGSIAGASETLDRAADWVASAERDIESTDAFVGPPPTFPDSRAAMPTSVLFGEAGVWWMSAVVHAAVGDDRRVDRATGRFCAIAAACPEDALDVAGGAAGLLLAAAGLLEQLGDIAPQRVRAAGEDLARRLSEAATHRGRGSSDPLGWWGAAHGWCGVAHALLRWCRATGTRPDAGLEALLASLRAARLPSGAWPRSGGSSEVWPGWCHGSAGWALLWALAGDVLGDGELLALAEPPAVHAVIGRGGSAGLCCGLAGRAYAALAMYRATGESAWLPHAKRLAVEAAGSACGPDFPQHSLWGGDVGVALLALDIGEPDRAAMPIYAAHR